MDSLISLASPPLVFLAQHAAEKYLQTTDTIRQGSDNRICIKDCIGLPR